MSPAQHNIPHDEWISKDTAAARLGISVRSFMTQAAEGKIRRKLERDEKSHQQVARFHGGDVDMLIYDRANPKALQPVKVAPLQISSQLQASPAKVAKGDLSELLRALAGFSSPAPIVAWMTLEQASEYCGLSRTLLLHLIRTGELKALRDKPMKEEGKRAAAGSSWRVCRRDLDALQGVRVQEPVPPAPAIVAEASRSCV